MTLQLIIMRHAKSGWDDPGLSDHDRPLTAKGVTQAEKVGRWLNENCSLPDMILSSTATRAAETARIVAQQMDPRPDIEFSARVYHAGPDAMIDVLSRLTPQSVMLVGHNPSISILADLLTVSANGIAEMSDFKTATAAVLEFEISSWAQLSTGTGVRTAIVSTKDLPD
jgi:phosphohistidine phosphatase